MIKRLQKHLWVCPLLIIAILLIVTSIPDSDSFFLIATGEHIVENGIPYINPFVIHENFSIVVQQWLFDIGIFCFYDIFGIFGLFLFTFLIFCASIFMMYNFLKLFTNNTTSIKLITFAFGVLICRYQVARPSCVSILLFTILLYCLEKYHQTHKTKWLFLLPVLSLIQVNVHSSMWPLMLVFIVPYFFPYLNFSKPFNIKEWFKNNSKLLLSVVIMCLCGFINPYGLDGILYVIKSYNNANSLEITELMSPPITSTNGIVIMITIIILTIWLPKLFQKIFKEKIDTQNEFIRLYGLLGTTLLSAFHMRNLWFTLLWLCPIAVKMLENILVLKPRKIKVCLTILSYILTICVICGIFIINNGTYSTLTNKDSEFAPIKAVEYLNKYDKETITLFTEFNNGAYCEFNGYKVYMDARPELFAKAINKKEDVLNEYAGLIEGKTNFNEFIQKYDFTHMISSNDTMLNAHLKECDDFKLVIEGEGYCLFESIRY